MKIKYNLPMQNIKLQENVPLKDYTTLNIGGPAKALFTAKTEDDLIQAIKLAQKEHISYLVIGGGSNLLISNEEIDKLIIKNTAEGLTLQREILCACSGTPLQELVDLAVGKGLSGIQKLTGIPGTVGGAVYGNAGAYGQTISDSLIEVRCFDPQNLKVVTLSKEGCGFDYRHSNFKSNHLIVLEAKFELQSTDPQTLKEEAQQILSDRLNKYPKGLKCPGSFFKNLPVSKIPTESLKLIPKDKVIYDKVPAGYLLDSVGAKGQKQGNIQISPNNANLFINLGSGTALDFWQLAQKYAQKVKEKYGITLEPEVQFINLPPT